MTRRRLSVVAPGEAAARQQRRDVKHETEYAAALAELQQHTALLEQLAEQLTRGEEA